MRLWHVGGDVLSLWLGYVRQTTTFFLLVLSLIATVWHSRYSRNLLLNLGLHHHLITLDIAHGFWHSCLRDLVWIRVLLKVHGGYSALEAIATIMGHSSSLLHTYASAWRKGLFLREVGPGTWRCTKLVLHDPLVADVIIAAKGNVLVDTRLIQIEATTEVLEPSLSTEHLLLLLLLGIVELVDSCMAILRSESWDRVWTCEWVWIAGHGVHSTAASHLHTWLIRLDVVARDEVK